MMDSYFRDDFADFIKENPKIREVFS